MRHPRDARRARSRSLRPARRNTALNVPNTAAPLWNFKISPNFKGTALNLLVAQRLQHVDLRGFFGRIP